jgi:hypothetical protein
VGLLAHLPLEQQWKLLIEAVRAARKPSLAAVLEHAVPLEISGASVTLGMPRAQARAGLLSDKDNRAALEAAFERVLGVRVPIKVQEHEGSVPVAGGEATPAPMQSLAEQKQKVRAQALSSRLQQGREHPHVKAALELLGGEIEDVRDLGEE